MPHTECTNTVYIVQATSNKQYKYLSFYLLHNTANMHFMKIYVDIDNTHKWHLYDLKIRLSILSILFVLHSIEKLTPKLCNTHDLFHHKEKQK